MHSIDSDGNSYQANSIWSKVFPRVQIHSIPKFKIVLGHLDYNFGMFDHNRSITFIPASHLKQSHLIEFHLKMPFNVADSSAWLMAWNRLKSFDIFFVFFHKGPIMILIILMASDIWLSYFPFRQHALSLFFSFSRSLSLPLALLNRTTRDGFSFDAGVFRMQ